MPDKDNISISIVDVQEFLVQLLTKERNLDPQQPNGLSAERPSDLMTYDILADPLMFVRKWMGEVRLKCCKNPNSHIK